MSGSAYRPILTGDLVEAAVEQHIKRWSRDYLAEVCRQRGLDPGTLAPFRSFLPALDPAEPPPHAQMPAVLVVVPGTADVERHGTFYDVNWDVLVGVVTTGPNHRDTFRNLHLYLGALRSLFVQKPSLGVDWTGGTYWQSERSDVLPANTDTRTIALGEISLLVNTPQVVDSRGGTQAPIITNPDPEIEEPDEAAPSWGTVQAVDVELRKRGA